MSLLRVNIYFRRSRAEVRNSLLLFLLRICSANLFIRPGCLPFVLSFLLRLSRSSTRRRPRWRGGCKSTISRRSINEARRRRRKRRNPDSNERKLRFYSSKISSLNSDRYTEEGGGGIPRIPEACCKSKRVTRVFSREGKFVVFHARATVNNSTERAPANRINI